MNETHKRRIGIEQLAGNVRRCYVIRALYQSLSLTLAGIVILWQQLGLSQRDVFLMELIFAAIIFAFQIPTGMLADRIGRKKTILLGSSMVALGCVLYLFVASGFWSLLTCEVFLAIGLSALSGADEALIFHSLSLLRMSDRFGTLWGRAQSWALCASALGCVVGGFLSEVNPRSPFILSVVANTVLFIVALRLVEPEMREDTRIRLSWKGLSEVVRRWAWGDRQVAWLLVHGSLMFSLWQVALWIYPFYYRETGGPLWGYGVLLATYNIIAAVASSQAKRLFAARGSPTLSDATPILAALVLILGVSYLAFGSYVWLVGCLFAIGHQIVRAIHPLIIASSINARIPEHHRATVLSLRGATDTLVYSCALGGLMLCSDTVSVGTLASGIGGIVLLVGGGSLLLRPKRAG